MSIKKLSQRAGLIVLMSISSVAVFFSISQAQTPPMTDEQITRIRTNCLSAKNTLRQLSASDALLRVNRGQLYLSMSSKLMLPFNGRVVGNNFSAKDLIAATNNYSNTLTAFQTDYKRYEQEMTKVLHIDCSKEPVSFYDSVAAARVIRHQVHADVIQLHTYIEEYRAHIDMFNTNFSSNKAGN